jgi:amino acid transporter
VARREIGAFSLTMIGLGSIIGSGWLFGAWKAAKVAGPAALISWLIGMVVIMFIGLTYAELGALFPETGGTVRYAQYSHGSFVGFLSGWANWIAMVSVIPIEAEASVQYMSSWKWHWCQNLFDGKSLSGLGLLLAAGLVIVYFLLNYWTVRLFARANTFITLFKFGVPLLTVGGLVFAGFHPGNFAHVSGGFMPYGWSSVFSAVASSGIVFAFLGFTTPINLAGEAKNPNRTIPMAVLGSILLAGVIYLCLQTAFIGAVKPDMLANGWANIALKSPFADLAMALNLNWLALILFSDAFVSPSGTGMAYTASTARMIQGLEHNGYFPKVFGRTNQKYGAPRPAMWLNLLISFGFLYVFRGWGSLADVISIATLISFVTGPVSAMALRKTAGNLHRPLKIAGMNLVAPIAFVFASLILYWASWPLTGEVIVLMLVGLPIYFYYQSKKGWQGFQKNVSAGLWLVLYLLSLALISYLGSPKFGGSGVLPYGIDMALVALVSLGFYHWGVKSSWKTKDLSEMMEQYDDTGRLKHELTA